MSVNLSLLDDILLSGRSPEGGPRIHLMLLNWELAPSTTLLRLLRVAHSITCADGGANRLLQRMWEFDLPTCTDVFYLKSGERKALHIVGDCDSILTSVDDVTGLSRPPIDQLIAVGFKLVKIEDDYSPDFEKSITYITEKGIVSDGDYLLVDGAFGGRFDQNISIISSLYRLTHLQEVTPEPYRPGYTRIGGLRFHTILMGPESVCCLLDPGKSQVKIPTRCATRVCGLLPLIPVESVSTRGLKWDLENAPMAMNGLISSSNQAEEDIVQVETSHPIMWYSQLQPF